MECSVVLHCADPSYYHITASTSQCCSCSVANAGCVCRVSILPIIQTADLIQNYLDQMVLLEFYKFYIDHTSIFTKLRGAF